MIAAVVGGYLIAALALQHAAYIIQYGSIFEMQRQWLRRQARRHWWAQKLDELVHCQLCTITQLSLWWVTLPIAWVEREHIVSYPVAALVVLSWVWFSVAALGLAAWDICRLVGRGTDALVLRARGGK